MRSATRPLYHAPPSHAVLEEVRWFFEHSEDSLSRIARDYAIARTTLQYRISLERWQKYVPPANPQQHARDLLAVQAKRAERETRMSLGGIGPSALHEMALADQRALCDQGVPPASILSAPAAPRPLPNSAPPSPALVIPFPRPIGAQENNPEAEHDSLAGLLQVPRDQRGGSPAERTRDRIEELNEVLAAYLHLLHVYMVPDEWVGADGLPVAEAGVKAVRLRRAARDILMPTERDTLTATMKTATACVEALVALTVKLPSSLNVAGDKGPAAAIKHLSLDQLRRVKAAIDMLNGPADSQDEPPMPPPDPLTDLIVPAHEN